MPDYIFPTRAAAEATDIPDGVDIIHVLSYSTPGDGGAAIWVRAASQPSHPAKFQDAGSAWWELERHQVVSPRMLGALGNSDAAGSAGTDDTTAIDNTLAFANDIYLSPGFYKVTELLGDNFTTTQHLWGPGLVVASTANTPFYGDTIVAGIKIGNATPTAPHGGFLIGGSGPTPEGTFLRATNEGIVEFIPSRTGNITELQVYTNAINGYGNRTDDTVSSVVTSSPLSLIYPNDIVWLNTTRYRIDSITSSTQFVIKNYDGSAWSGTVDDATPYFWTGYHHAVHTGNYNSTTHVFTRTSGELVSVWGEDHNLILAGVRYEITTQDANAGTFTLATGPGASLNGVTATHRWVSSEDYLALFRLQAARGAGKEMHIAHFVRPDFAGLRVGTTVGDDYAYYLDYHCLSSPPSDDPHTGQDNMEGERYTYLTLKDGHLGIHERTPNAALHVTRHYGGTHGADNQYKEIAQFKVAWAGGLSHYDANSVARRLAISSRNNFRALALQCYDVGMVAQQMCIQPAGGKCHFGSWNAVTSGFDFEFSGNVRGSGIFAAAGIYTTTSASAPNVVVDASGQLKRSTSSQRFKTAIEPIGAECAARVWDLEPVCYRSTAPGDDPQWSHWGLVAEQVAAVDPRLVHWGDIDPASGERIPEGVQYDRVCVLLLAELKRERIQSVALEARVGKLEARLASEPPHISNA